VCAPGNLWRLSWWGKLTVCVLGEGGRVSGLVSQFGQCSERVLGECLLVVELIEWVAGSGCWVFVEHLVGWFMAGLQVRTLDIINFFGWGVLGCVVMAFGWFIGGLLCELLVVVVSAGIAGFSMMCILLLLARAW